MTAKRWSLPLRAEGQLSVKASPDVVRRALLDPMALTEIIPGAERVTRRPDGSYSAVLAFGIGPFQDRQSITLVLEQEADEQLSLSGRATGRFGTGEASGDIKLRTQEEGTLVSWRYAGTVSGAASLLGSTVLNITATRFTNRAFANLRQVVERPSR
jgi:carbon monoxide dehydrogenase subunit G